jgi:hypothetical protein
MNYFDPTTVSTMDATFNYIAKSGVGFALTPDNEQVFIAARFIEQLNLQVGDGLKVWVVDNHASPQTAHYPSRWRAIRVVVVVSILDQEIAHTSPKVETPLSDESVGDFVGMFTRFFNQVRPWTAQSLTNTIAKSSPPLAFQPDLLQRVTTRLNAMHRSGEAASLKVYAKFENDRASAVYYAKDADVFYEYLDTPLDTPLGEEEE